MLTRIRIEVEGEDSAAACEEALSKYEHVLQEAEINRFRSLNEVAVPKVPATRWDTSILDRDFYNAYHGREVTDEVIEYDSSVPGYKGRRVVHFRRIDTRKNLASEEGHSECLGGGRFCATSVPAGASNST